MKRPAFQFYPADWRNNAKLSRCSWAARGAWVATLGLLHDSDEYGVLRWPLKEISQAIGCPHSLVKELADKQVLKGSDREIVAYVYAPRHGGKVGAPVVLIESGEGPCWYSSRMVRDEYIRTKRGIGTRFGDQPEPSPKVGIGGRNGNPKGGIGDGPTASASSSIHAVPTPGIDAGATDGGTALGDRSPGKSKAKANGAWWATPEATSAHGEEIGKPPKRGETWPEYKERLFRDEYPNRALP